MGADTTHHVQVPLDVVWSYVWRAKEQHQPSPVPGAYGNQRRTLVTSRGKRDAPARASTQQQETKLSLMNGEKLCPAFQKGACRAKGNECAAGRHKCAVVTSAAGRVCGMSDHGAINHAKKVKGKGKS